jgi:glycosyltransferase involved in cell wall biosynthesis
VRILVDYRPALKERSGVGEYIHELAGALARRLEHDDRLILFTSSWSDRLDARVTAGWPRTEVLDRHIPVRALTFGWNRLGWPPIERLAGPLDVVHSPSPILVPSRNASQIITIHDLDFLSSPERTSAEMRSDYPRLVHRHAAEASLIVVNSEDTARAVTATLHVSRDRLIICRPGIPSWIRSANVPGRAADQADQYVLFVGTLEPRKNLGILLDAWERLLGGGVVLPRLRVAGLVRPGGEAWVHRMRTAPLSGHVDYVGYVGADARQALYRGARLLVLPSLHEGFGLPVLEAMALGVPVVTSDRGALPEVVGDAGVLVPADDSAALATAIQRVLENPAAADSLRRHGLARAASFTWDTAADALYRAYLRRGRRA